MPRPLGLPEAVQLQPPTAAPDLGSVLEGVRALTYVVLGFGSLITLALGGLALWTKAKFFQPLKAEIFEVAATAKQELEAACSELNLLIEKERAARREQQLIMEGTVRALEHTTSRLADAVEAISSAEITKAMEAGRQAERLHYLANVQTTHVLKLESLERSVYARRKEDPHDG